MIDEEAELDRLYSLPPEEFTAARNELAKRFRDQGERAIAARIKELKKPTLSAWVVNQLSRRRELDVERLLKAGDRLREAQLDAIAREDAGHFLDARRDEQAALSQLSQAARELLESSGRSTGVLDRVVSTLRSAATRDDGRQLLKGGRLSEDLQPGGFEALAGIRFARRPRGTKQARREAERGPTSPAAEEKAAKRRAIAAARADLRQLQRELRNKSASMDRAVRDVERVREALEEAEEKAAEAKGEFEQAERAVEASEQALRDQLAEAGDATPDRL